MTFPQGTQQANVLSMLLVQPLAHAQTSETQAHTFPMYFSGPQGASQRGDRTVQDSFRAWGHIQVSVV